MNERVDGANAPVATTDDERQLAELGYKQELTRAWSGFTNFAISFTIISVLAGTFTTFGQAWNAGGPLAISIGWPVICAFVLLVAVSMSELTSAFPTAGGPYWWAARLGGAGLELVHGLVQHRRPGRHRGLGRLRRGVLPGRACSRSTASTSSASTSATTCTSSARPSCCS